MSGLGSGKRSVPITAFPAASECVHPGPGLIYDGSHLMVIPAIRIVVGQDHRCIVPVRLLLKEIDNLHNKCLLVQWVGVAGVSILIGRSLEKTHSRKIPGAHCRKKVAGVVLVTSSIVVMTDHRDGRWPRMGPVLRELVILKWLMVWNVVTFKNMGNL